MTILRVEQRGGGLASLGRVGEALPRQLHRGTVEAARQMQSELRRNAPRGKSGRLARSFEVQVRKAGEVSVSSPLPYARILDRGGVIRPRSRGALAIPLTNAKSTAGLTFIRRDGRNPLLAEVSRHGIDPRFVLVRQVALRGHRYVDTSVRRGIGAVARYARQAVELAAREGTKS